MYAIAYTADRASALPASSPALAELEGQRRRLRAGFRDRQLPVRVAVGAGPAGDRLHERRLLLLGGGDDAGGDELTARERGDVVALRDRCLGRGIDAHEGAHDVA